MSACTCNTSDVSNGNCLCTSDTKETTTNNSKGRISCLMSSIREVFVKNFSRTSSNAASSAKKKVLSSSASFQSALFPNQKSKGYHKMALTRSQTTSNSFSASGCDETRDQQKAYICSCRPDHYALTDEDGYNKKDEDGDSQKDADSLGSDDSFWDDFSCTVCERSFINDRQLHRHRLKKRHWGCSECDLRFDSEMLLEYHKDFLGHWSIDDQPYDSHDSDFESLRECMNDNNDYEYEFGPDDEEKEMLLL